MNRGAWQATVHGVARVGYDLVTKPPQVVIVFLPWSQYLSISWLQSPTPVILEPMKIKSVIVSIVSPSICNEGLGPDAIIFVF